MSCAKTRESEGNYEEEPRSDGPRASQKQKPSGTDQNCPSIKSSHREGYTQPGLEATGHKLLTHDNDQSL